MLDQSTTISISGPELSGQCLNDTSDSTQNFYKRAPSVPAIAPGMPLALCIVSVLRHALHLSESC